MGVRPFGILAVSLLTTHSVVAQQRASDTVLKGSTIEVIQSYRPQVRKAPKPEWLPQLPPPDTTRPVLSYDVPQQTLYYSYTSGALRPLALGRDSLVMPYPNYVKVGGGNLSTLYLDAGIGSLRGKNYETGIHLHHISQKGSISSQQSALSGLEAEGNVHKGTKDWHVYIKGERDQYNFYGREHITTIGPAADTKQAFTLVKAGADMTDRSRTHIQQFQYRPSVSASVYKARFNAGETQFDLNVPMSYRLDSSLTLEAIVSASLAHLNMTDAKASNNFAMLKPGVALTGKISGHAYLGLGAGKGGDLYILPDVVADYRLPATSIKLSGGWVASVRQNTYQQLTTENPYVYTDYVRLFDSIGLRQTRTDELYASVSASQGKHLNYVVKVGWSNFTNLATYLNGFDNPVLFNVVYNDVSAISIHAAARYTQANIWSAGLSGSFYKFYQGAQPYVWGQPALNIKGDVSFAPVKNLSTSAYVVVLGGINAVDISGKAIMLTPVTDIGLYGEYDLNSRLSVFLQVSNLLSSRYERWRAYQAYGVNVYGGLRLKF